MPYPRISIALCTYNGARFLPELLKSLSEQVLIPDELIVCDDASSDSTLSWIKQYSADALYPIKIIENSRRLGVLENYSRAISSCTGDYIALSDQDDIWLPGKLELSVQRMKDAELTHGVKTPLLVHSDLKIIDHSGVVIAESFFKHRKLQPNHKVPLKILLVQNFVTGCAALINRPLVEAALPIPEKAVMHDWWLALIAAAKGRIIFEPRPTVLYREHDKNVIGPKGFFTRENVLRVANSKNLEEELAAAIKQAQALSHRLASLPDHERIDYIEDYLNAVYSGGHMAVKQVLKHGIKKMGWIRNIALIILLYKGGYRRYLY